MSRSRALSAQGKYLLNMGMHPDYVPVTKPKRKSFIENKKNLAKKSLSKLFCNFFHTDYDDKLEESVVKFKNSSCKLYTVDNFNKNISKLINNAITNLIYLVLTEDDKAANYNQARKNFQYYMDVAKKASDEGDHQTAVLIWSALSNTAIYRLDFKLRKKDTRILLEFQDKYGEFGKGCSKHIINLKEIRKNEEIPSLMMLLINIGKFKERGKALKRSQKFKNLKKAKYAVDLKIEEISEAIKHYKFKYISNDKLLGLLKLYTDPYYSEKMFKNTDEKNITLKLLNLSNSIKNPKKQKRNTI
jgi:hypothetical protein